MTVETNIAKKVLQLVSKHFPNGQVFNGNNETRIIKAYNNNNQVITPGCNLCGIV